MKGFLMGICFLWPLWGFAGETTSSPHQGDVYSAQQGCMGCHQGAGQDEGDPEALIVEDN